VQAECSGTACSSGDETCVEYRAVAWEVSKPVPYT